MMTLEEYRKAILDCILNARSKDGEPRTDEATANIFLSSISDTELEEGMDFNTPEEVAEMVLEVL